MISSSLFPDHKRFIEALRILVAGDPSFVEFLEFVFISVLFNKTFLDKFGRDSNLYCGLSFFPVRPYLDPIEHARGG